MAEPKEPVDIPGLEEVSRHDHLCLLYEEEGELVTPVVGFLQKGLSLGERCVYMNAGEETLERVLRNAVSGQKHDIGALMLLSVDECWLKGGSFDPGRVLQLMDSLCTGAGRDGFKAVRIICDMGWAGGDSERGRLLSELELAFNRFTADNAATILCLYKRSQFKAERMLELAKIHPHLVLNGKICTNPLFLEQSRDRSRGSGAELEVFLFAAHAATSAAADQEKLRHELEQAYAALARKIYENWQEEDTRRASEKELHDKDEALLAHRRRLQTILQHLPTMLMAFDTSGALAACNHEFERVTGYKAEEVMGKQILDLIQVESALRGEVLTAHPPEGGHYRGKEWSVRCKDGSLRNVSWSNISRYVAIPGWSNWLMGQDVTPRVHAELGLKTLSQELDARTGELEAFGIAVSHDLSGQLSRISGHCAMMQDLHGRALSPQCRELLHSIHEATLEMVGRINALQRFTTLAAAEIQPEEVDLSAMASEIAATLRRTGRERPVTFQIQDGVTATGDPKLLRLAMEQLLENAWNYTVGVQHPVIQFGTAQVAGERSFYVKDNGPRSLAESGSHLSVRQRDNHLCCGIGLATVEKIITLHRGRIWATDHADEGGTLYFTV
jgi:PAS domain S-box-containing protein